MEEQIQNAINDVKAGLYTRIEGQNLFAQLQGEAEDSTQHLVDSGNVNLRRHYMEMLSELSHYVLQLPKESKPDHPPPLGH